VHGDEVFVTGLCRIDDESRAKIVLPRARIEQPAQDIRCLQTKRPPSAAEKAVRQRAVRHAWPRPQREGIGRIRDGLRTITIEQRDPAAAPS
jgi:hypothetical protein